MLFRSRVRIGSELGWNILQDGLRLRQPSMGKSILGEEAGRFRVADFRTIIHPATVSPHPCCPREPSSPASGASTLYVWILIEVLHLEHLEMPPRGAVRGSCLWERLDRKDCTSTLPRLASSTSAQHSASSGNPVIYNCSSSLVDAVENFDLVLA